MTRVAITNTVALNGGDAAIAIAIVEAVQRALPEADIELHDAHPEVAGRYYRGWPWRRQIAALPRRTRRPRRGAKTLRKLNETRLIAAARLLRTAAGRRLGSALLRRQELASLTDFAGLDVIVSTGGTYLVGQYALWPRIFEYRLAAALDIPVVFYTQSLGPFPNRSDRARLQGIFARSPLVLLRDERSRRHLLELGVPPDALHVVADAVFGRARIREIELSSRTPVATVAVSVRRWPVDAADTDPAVTAFRGAIAAAVVWLVRERGVDVTFLSTCQGIREYWVNDAAEALAIVEQLPEDARSHVTVDEEFHAPDTLAEAYAGFDLVVATRMHAAILALTAGTPVFPIAYEFKTTELFAGMGLADRVVEFDGITGAVLVARLRTFLDDLPAVAAALAAGVSEQQAEAEEAVRLLGRTVRSTPARPRRVAQLRSISSTRRPTA